MLKKELESKYLKPKILKSYKYLFEIIPNDGNKNHNVMKLNINDINIIIPS
jgi:hypothetical protein